jgi:hypothetical protein
MWSKQASKASSDPELDTIKMKTMFLGASALVFCLWFVGFHMMEATRALPPLGSICHLTQDQLIDTCGNDGVLNAQ